ncbi:MULTISPECIES: hypothetical protein [unclassified Stygiolobus]|uniref:hypothetical protein n=1 Tax=unclassified Stygiolobus TaxID=2824672 RepID=UPI00307F9DEC
MQLPRGLDWILHEMKDKVKDGFEKIKDKANKSIEYLDKKLKGIGDKTYEKLRETKNKISEYIPIYIPIVGGAAITALPTYAKAPIMVGLQIKNLYKDTKGKILGYGLILGGITALGLGIMFLFNPIHSLPSNNEHVQYLGSQTGYEAFIPNGQTISYDGNTDPEGELILNNGTIIHNVIWDGHYSGTIIQNHDQIAQLNHQFVGQTDPINNQPYEPLVDVYIIKGPVQIINKTIDGQTYYVIEANSINPADIAGFYTYQGWVNNFVEAMNTPGTYAAGLPGNSPVYDWANVTGTLPRQIILYGQHSPNLIGGGLLVLPNETIIPYGIIYSPSGSAFSSFIAPSRVYNISS